jgi:V/A-type H+-transporting ATPase subunit C
VLLKSSALGKDESRLFLPLGRVRPEKLSEAFREQKFSELPPVLGAALLDAADTLSRTGDPRLADFILDKAYIEEMSRTAEAAGSGFLAGFARLWADVYNLRSLMRMIKSGVSTAKLELILTDRGSVDLGKIKNSYPDVISVYKGTGLSAALPSAESTVAGESFSLFERVCSDVLDKYMREARFQSFGEKVLIYYLYQVERA